MKVFAVSVTAPPLKLQQALPLSIDADVSMWPVMIDPPVPFVELSKTVAGVPELTRSPRTRMFPLDETVRFLARTT